MYDNVEEVRSDKVEFCPHCGERLSPWQQVLLGVDHAVMCRHCWYRIVLKIPVKGSTDNAANKKSEEK